MFDRYVDFVMSCGITGRINCYSLIPWIIEFSYYDEASGIGQMFTHSVGTEEYNVFWGTMLKDSRFTAWPAGDTYQVYPGPLPSIRFEKLNEGIQDFEKIRLLREEYKAKRKSENWKGLKLHGQI